MNSAHHIAIIMDGNGRWAQERNLKRVKGHEKGANVVRSITEYCAKEDDIERLTLYAFSTENWKRPRLEVEYLMSLLEKHLKAQEQTYIQNNIKFEVIGDIRAFSTTLQKTIRKLEEKTADGDALVQSLALNYGAKDEILRAINKVKSYEGEITEEIFANTLDCKSDVDLLIRTGGDKRLSNFLLWQVSYAELFFCDTLWPDFTPAELEGIIQDFKKIERRFGGLK